MTSKFWTVSASLALLFLVLSIVSLLGCTAPNPDTDATSNPEATTTCTMDPGTYSITLTQTPAPGRATCAPITFATTTDPFVWTCPTHYGCTQTSVGCNGAWQGIASGAGVVPYTYNCTYSKVDSTHLAGTCSRTGFGDPCNYTVSVAP